VRLRSVSVENTNTCCIAKLDYHLVTGTLLPITYVFFLSILWLNPQPSPESFQKGGFGFVRGGVLKLKKLTKLNWFIVFHVSIWEGLELRLWGLRPQNTSCGDETGFNLLTFLRGPSAYSFTTYNITANTNKRFPPSMYHLPTAHSMRSNGQWHSFVYATSRKI